MALFLTPRALVVALTISLYFAVADAFEARSSQKTCGKGCIPTKNACIGACSVCDLKTRKCVAGKGQKTETSSKGEETPMSADQIPPLCSKKMLNSGGCTTRRPPGTKMPPTKCLGVVTNLYCGTTYIHKTPKTYSGDFKGALAEGDRIVLTGRVEGQEVNGNNKWYKHMGGYVPGTCIQSFEGGQDWCN